MKLPSQLAWIKNARLPQKSSDVRLDGKTVIVTGATSGVGYAAAHRLAEAGASLVLICRNAAKTEAVIAELASAYGTHASVAIADFASLASVRRAGEEILESGQRIDVLVNNVGMHSTTRTLTAEGNEKVFCVNHLSSFLLTHLLIPRLREADAARIVNVNSQGHRFGGLDLNDLDWSERKYRSMGGYGASKTAQLPTLPGFTDMLRGSKVTINAMHPGAVKSNIGSNNGPIYEWYSRTIIERFLKEPQIAGNAIHYLAAAPELSEVTGRYFNLTNEEEPAPHATDPALAERVWELSCALTGTSA